MLGLTGRQKQVLRAIFDMTEASGYPPSSRELGEELLLAHTTAFEHMKALIKKGYLSSNPGRVRSWVPTDKARAWRNEDGLDTFVANGHPPSTSTHG